jgi:excisionase family DNA binding protein
VCRTLLAAVKILSRGDAIAIGAVHHRLTTTEAADLLGVSRQYLIRLIDRGELPHELVGRHRRLRLGDVLAYKSLRTIERQKALDELTRLDAELGAYD